MFGLKTAKPKSEAGSAGSAGPVPGLMQDQPINLASILVHAAQFHRHQVMVSASPEGRVRQTYAQTHDRAQKLANALKRLGVKPGDRIGTFAWNTHRHVEAWYAISGQGAICHTLNPRLPAEQLAFIINHAEDRMLMIDPVMAAQGAKLCASLPMVEKVIVMCGRAQMPHEAVGDRWVCYEELIEPEAASFDWPSFSEETASSLCYTSGTTGDPKGVLYSHRSNLLHAWAIAQKDVQNLGCDDTTLMIVPMFHANAWGLVYGGPMVGARLVLPGPALDGASVHRLIKEEQVTTSSAVPTVWAMLLAHLEKSGGDLAPLKEVIIGGAPVPRAMVTALRERYGVQVVHGWGMTELSPVGSINRPMAKYKTLPVEKQDELACRAGKPLYGVEMKIVDDAGGALPHDGETSGRLLVRGPWIAKAYYRRPDPILDADGWFDTGDVASIDADGYMSITDRAKDIIKSGGEWISSVDLENCAMGAAGVQLACAVGIPHAKWGERPLLLVVPKAGQSPQKQAILDHLCGSCAKWQLPDEIVFVDALPLTAAGKFDKKVLRVKYKDQYAGA